jgi:MFS transporter, DHA1 family, tetracycline resistance protein
VKKPSVLVIFLTVMIDLIGFGIVLPLLPILSRNYGASGLAIGIIMAAFSTMQFLFAPLWGRLSDRIGRRPVLLLSTAFASASYVLFALGCGLEGRAALAVILVSRVVAGICGANISVAQAYIADITPMDQRSRRMGLIGMAFGLGFIIGPAIGSFSVGRMGPPGPGWVAAACCALNFVCAAIFLKESWTPSAEHVKPRPRLEQWVHTFRQPAPALLISVFFLATFCFTCYETTLGLLIGVNFDLDPTRTEDARVIGYLFTYSGLIGALVQGGAIGRAVAAFGEPKVIAASLILVAVSMVPMPFLHSWPLMLVALALLATGASLARPPVFGMLSIVTPTQEQGATFGIAQGVGSLARIVGPIFAGAFFQHHIALPYTFCAVVSLLTGVLAWRLLPRHRPAVA